MALTRFPLDSTDEQITRTFLYLFCVVRFSWTVKAVSARNVTAKQSERQTVALQRDKVSVLARLLISTCFQGTCLYTVLTYNRPVPFWANYTLPQSTTPGTNRYRKYFAYRVTTGPDTFVVFAVRFLRPLGDVRIECFLSSWMSRYLGFFFRNTRGFRGPTRRTTEIRTRREKRKNRMKNRHGKHNDERRSGKGFFSVSNDDHDRLREAPFCVSQTAFIRLSAFQKISFPARLLSPFERTDEKKKPFE